MIDSSVKECVCVLCEGDCVRNSHDRCTTDITSCILLASSTSKQFHDYLRLLHLILLFLKLAFLTFFFASIPSFSFVNFAPLSLIQFHTLVQVDLARWTPNVGLHIPPLHESICLIWNISAQLLVTYSVQSLWLAAGWSYVPELLLESTSPKF